MTAVYWKKKDTYIVITERQGTRIGFTDAEGKWKALNRYHKDSCVPVDEGEVWEACKERSRYYALRPIVREQITAD